LKPDDLNRAADTDFEDPEASRVANLNFEGGDDNYVELVDAEKVHDDEAEEGNSDDEKAKAAGMSSAALLEK
jgi:hypothetical protein